MTAFDSVRASLTAQSDRLASLLTDVSTELQQVSALAQSIKDGLDAENQADADQIVALINANTAKIEEAAGVVRSFVADTPAPTQTPDTPVDVPGAVTPPATTDEPAESTPATDVVSPGEVPPVPENFTPGMTGTLPDPNAEDVVQ